MDSDTEKWLEKLEKIAFQNVQPVRNLWAPVQPNNLNTANSGSAYFHEGKLIRNI